VFDAAAALIGFVSNQIMRSGTIELEAVADLEENKSYAIEINHQEIDRNALECHHSGLREGVAVPILAARFHNSNCPFSP
jgi:hypothetical protein